jgi:hypothetical protein
VDIGHLCFSLEEAERAAREAIAVIANLKDISEEEKTAKMSYAIDTLVYILMQTGHLGEALEWKEKDSYTKEGGSIFRYALLLNILGKEDEACSKLKISMGDLLYYPSHELYLFNRYFLGSSPFVKTFNELSAR